ncbi:hypothetical protein OAP55_01420 [Alphaproteobacteria bacterium]|nr:hypothetical protein [Alphaproteobacteria bacterium]
MKNYFPVLLILFFTHFNIVLADEFNVDITFLTDAGSSADMIFGDKLTVRHFNGTASWKDSIGDYGILKCLGNYVSSKKEGTILNNYCQGSNKDGDIFWLVMQRKSKDYGGGVGKSEYIYGEGKFKRYIGAECIYAVEITKDFSILKQKCKTK